MRVELAHGKDAPQPSRDFATGHTGHLGMGEVLKKGLSNAKGFEIILIQLVDCHALKTVIDILGETYRLAHVVGIILPKLPVQVIDRKKWIVNGTCEMGGDSHMFKPPLTF